VSIPVEVRETQGADTVIDGRTVLRPAIRCIVREQVDQYLLYNARTDELHLLEPTGFYAYCLVDGSRTVAEVEALLGDSIDAEPSVLQAAARSFFRDLVDRRLLEPVATLGRQEATV